MDKKEIATQVKHFYDDINFPGRYSLQQLYNYKELIENPILAYIEKNTKDAKNVLDVGCGTGLIANLLALRNKSLSITGIDFSKSVHYAKEFSDINNINNVNFKKSDILTYKSQTKFDVLICQGVLHHIPDLDNAIKNIDKLIADDGVIILGLYHPMGKVMKKIIKINYRNEILYKDQELHPYEVGYTKKEVKKLFKNFVMVNHYPKRFLNLHSLLTSRNGGLCVYTLRRKQ